MQKTMVLEFIIIALLIVSNSFAEEIVQYTPEANAIIDNCLRISYAEVSEIARTWKDEEQVADYFDQSVADSYTYDDIDRPYRIYVFYPTDSFNSLKVFDENRMDASYVSRNTINWQALWNINMFNITGQTSLPVKYLASAFSRLGFTDPIGLADTCYVVYQLSEASPCFITLLHPMDSTATLIYTTGIDVNSDMSNSQVLLYNLRMKYGVEAFVVVDATSYIGK